MEAGTGGHRRAAQIAQPRLHCLDDLVRRQLRFLLPVVLLVVATSRFMLFERQVREAGHRVVVDYSTLSVGGTSSGLRSAAEQAIPGTVPEPSPQPLGDAVTTTHAGDTGRTKNEGQASEAIGDAAPSPHVVEHQWLSLQVAGRRLWVVGAYLRPSPRSSLMVLAVYEGDSLGPLEGLACVLPSGARLEGPRATQIRHIHNKAVLVAFPVPAAEAAGVREAAARGARAELMLMAEGGGRVDGLLLEVPPASSDSRSPPPPRMVHCLGTLFGTVNVAALVEWVEYFSALGVDHFHVYDSTRGPVEDEGLHSVLQAYASEGLVSYHPWQGIGCLDDHECEADTRVRYTYHGQDLAIHDCFLREEGRATWLLYGDLDEVWVIEDGGTAQTTTQLLPVLEALHDAEPHFDAWILKKVWVLTNDQLPSDEGGQLLLPQFTRKDRGAQQGAGGNGRVKYALRVDRGNHTVQLPLQVHEPGPEGRPCGYIKPRKDVNEGTGPNKAGVVMHFNHYETRPYSGTDHLRSAKAARPVEEVLSPTILQCVAQSLSLRPPDGAGCRNRRSSDLVRSVYRAWRGLSAKVPQTFSPFYLEPSELEAAKSASAS